MLEQKNKEGEKDNQPPIVTLTDKSGKAVEIPVDPKNMTVIEGIETEISLGGGKTEKITIGDKKLGYMRQNDYNRAHNQLQEKEKLVNEVKQQFESQQQEIEELKRQFEEPGKEQVPELAKLDIPTDADYDANPLEAYQKQNQALAVMKRLLLEQSKKEAEVQKTEEVKRKEAERIQAFANEMQPVLDEHPFLDLTKKDVYDVARASLFKELVRQHYKPGQEGHLPYAEIAQKVVEYFGNYDNAVVNTYVTKKDNKTKTATVPGQGPRLQDVIIESKNLEEYFDKAGEAFAVEPTLGE